MNYTSWVRIVCISDTHTLQRQVTVPDGDVLIHAGDICNHGTRGEVKQFISWLGELPHRHKVFIAGNHDWPFDKHGRHAHHWVKHGTYLQDTAITIEGLKFYGSPWQPEFCNWAFNLPRGKRLEFVWSSIPDDTDVLITHTPPRGILDSEERFGCEALAERLKDLNLKLHVFGHVHASHGLEVRGATTFVNASICDPDYEPVQPPIIVDL